MNVFHRLFLLAAVSSLAAFAHFVFVVPDANGTSARVFISETLEPDEAVGAKLIAGARFQLRGANGRDASLVLQEGGKFHTIALPGSGLRLIHGLVDLGLSQSARGPKPYVLLYHPKSIVGNPFADTKAVETGAIETGDATPVELIPMGKPGAVFLQMRARGKAHPNAEVTVILPDGKQQKVKTDASGNTQAFNQNGKYGAWARFWEPSSGEREGKKYEEVRHYATLVFETGAGATVSARYPALPQATSSFGSVVDGGWLYVYGGHISPTHSYSTEAVSGRFHRLNLTRADASWETLPEGPAMQGMNLAAFKGQIYRIGGMSPRNKPGDPSDNHSTAECARFDPIKKQWESIASLPEPRSSHDVIEIGGKLIVSGGWALEGGKQKWPETIAILDLNAPKPAWTSAPQPFKRRALMAAAHHGKMYVIGGFDAMNQIVRDVTIYDPATGQWSDGPKLPAARGLAFAPAATVHAGSLFVSVSDGTLYRLNESSQEWEIAGQATGRVAHRLGSHDATLLVIGGADKGANFDLVERVAISQSR